MPNFSRLTYHAIMTSTVLALLATPANAYIDPGSGSAIITTILGVFAAIGFTFRKYFYKLRRSLFGSKAGKQGENDK